MTFAYVGPAETKEEALSRLLQHHDFIAVDTETIALKGDKNVRDGDEKVLTDARTCIGIGVATSPTEAYYFPLGEDHNWPNVPECEVYEQLFEKLSRPTETKVYFNSIFDLDRIEERTGIKAVPFHDVAIACQVQGFPNSLENVAATLLMEDKQTISEILPSGKTMLDLPYPTTAFKCIGDVLTTIRLFNLLKMREWNYHEPSSFTDAYGHNHHVSTTLMDCYRIDLTCISILRKMSKRGIAVRPEKVNSWYAKLTGEMLKYEDNFRQYGFDPGSNDQVGYYLIINNRNWLPLTQTGKHIQVNEDVLWRLRDPVADQVLEWRKRRTLRSTFITPMLGKDRAYTHFRLDLSTGRLGSYDFNSQNLPDSTREIFQPDNGVWSWMDMHQIEMRVFAYQSKDPTLLNAYRNNESVHGMTMEALFPGAKKTLPNGLVNPQYTMAKTFNFAGFVYDASPQTLAVQTRLPRRLCEQYQNTLFQRYPIAKAYIDRTKKEPYSPWTPWVETDFGRRCRLPVDQITATEDHIAKCKVNYRDQGTAADIIKRAMIYCDLMGIDFPFQVHDEIVADGQVDWPELIKTIHPEIVTPFEAYSGPDWK